MKFLTVLLMTLSTCFALAAAPVAISGIEIPYRLENCDPDHADTMLLNLLDRRILVQDLYAGKLILADKNKPEAPQILDFPEGLLSLHLAENGVVYALMLNGVTRFSDLSAAITAIKDKKIAAAGSVVLQNAGLENRRSDYRLQVDKSGKYIVWDRSESLLQVFAADGSYIDAFPCPANPLLTGNDSFITSLHQSETGTRIVEISFSRPVANGVQQETAALNLELQTSNEIQLIGLDKSGAFSAVMLPPEPELTLPEEPSDDEVAGNADEKPSEFAVSQRSTEKETPGKDNAEQQGFIDPENPEKTQVILCSIDKAGSLKELSRLPFCFSPDRMVVSGDELYQLLPEYQTADDGCHLTRVRVQQQKISQ
ncbi:MAG TPA: hypothetical protein PLM07_00410 [Candidatus Rifleibacterium sp.]|nr:hypothetical protein [Candidatus Rifleibacterium sp.]HPT44341.1 hypothetical protein [Candidatus Rifleibacterium sp.]